MSSVLEAAGYTPRTKGISKRMQSIQISPIKQIPLLARDIPGTISLAWGIPSFPTPKNIREAAAKAALENDKLSYYSPTFGLPELLDALAKRIEERTGAKVDARNEIVVTMGNMEGLSGALATILDPEDEVIIMSPSFPSYSDQVKLYGGKPVYTILDESRNFALDLYDLKSKITPKTKAIILCNPNNPTGTVLKEADIRAIAGLAIEHDFWVITDDPYKYLTFDGHKYFSPMHIPEVKQNLIALRSFSKEYCMTGWRLGYLYAEAGFIREFLKFHDNTVISANTIAQMGGLEAITGPQEGVEERNKELTERRQLMGDRLRMLDDLFEVQDPEGAYYYFPKLKIDLPDIEFALRVLREAKVQCVPGGGCGPSAGGHIRFCFGYDKETINEAFDRMEVWWGRNKSELL
jgi:aminotransferase